MIRVKRGNIASKRRKKYLKLAKGYVGSNSRLSTFASEQVVQSLNFAYIGRRLKKRKFRQIWIYRISAVSKLNNINYSKLVGIFRKNNILLNKKMLSLLAYKDMESFNCLLRYIVKTADVTQ